MAYEEQLRRYVDEIGVPFDATALRDPLDGFAHVAKRFDLDPAQAAVLFILDRAKKLGTYGASMDLTLETRSRLLGVDYDAIKTLYYQMFDESRNRTREAG